MPRTASSPQISFHYLSKPAGFRGQRRLQPFIGEILRSEKTRATAVRFIFCTDAYLLDINRRFLRHDYYTDIISFNLAPKGEPVEGEIYISIDRVGDNALMLGQSFRRELHRVIFHGILHFCGYKDKSKKDQAVMRAKEDFYLSRYFN